MKSSGYINKQGQKNVMGLAYWPPRYFTLENNVFTYFLNETDKEMKGLYRLGKHDTVESKDGVLCLTSTFYKDDATLGNGTIQKLNMKFGNPKDHDGWYKTLRTVISYSEAAPCYTTSCFCRQVECVIVGKCTAEITCHCVDCSFFQDVSPIVLFPIGSLTVSKGYESCHVTKSTRENTSTLRGFCKHCHTLCFTVFDVYRSVGVPFNRLACNPLPGLSRSRPKFHVHYSSKRTSVKDGQEKFNDLPSRFGGSGNIVDDEGHFLHNEATKSSTKSATVAGAGAGAGAAPIAAAAVIASLKEDGSKPIALVTGGGGKIGIEVCKQLAGKGFRVLLSGQDQDTLNAATSKMLTTCGVQVETLLMDVMSDDSVSTAVETFAAKYPSGLEVLINMAGGEAMDGKAGVNVCNVSLEQAKDAMDVHVFSAWRVTQSFVSLLKAAAPMSRVVMIGNESAFKDHPCRASSPSSSSPPDDVDCCYDFSKLALHNLTLKFAQALKSDGVVVNTVCPSLSAVQMPGSGSNSVTEAAASIVHIAMLIPRTGEVCTTGALFVGGRQIQF